MPIERNPNDPYQSEPTQEELRRRATRFEEDYQADTNLNEGPASGGRIALFAIAIIAILGAIFYGMNSSTTDTTTQTTTTKSSSPSTTGSAPTPSQPSNTPAPSPAPTAPAAPSNR